jgi:hypothetical protein
MSHLAIVWLVLRLLPAFKWKATVSPLVPTSMLGRVPNLDGKNSHPGAHA